MQYSCGPSAAHILKGVVHIFTMVLNEYLYMKKHIFHKVTEQDMLYYK